VKVKLNVPPGGSEPEPNAPLSAVTVCIDGSSFVQIIFVPTFTVRVFGLKAKPTIAMLFGAVRGTLVAADVGAPEGPDVGTEVGTVGNVEEVVDVGVLADVDGAVPPHAARSITRQRASKHSRARDTVSGRVFCISLPLLQNYN
jgi:hypothetical protein